VRPEGLGKFKSSPHGVSNPLGYRVPLFIHIYSYVMQLVGLFIIHFPFVLIVSISLLILSIPVCVKILADKQEI
jgi:hypothetical protein